MRLHQEGGVRRELLHTGLPWWLSWQRICLQCRRPGFDPWVGKIPWRRKWQPTPVFWPGEFHGLYSPVQFSRSAVSDSLQPINRSTPGLPVHHQLRSLPKPMSIESVMPSSHLILCRPLLLLPSIPPSISVFSNESTLRIRWPKYWRFSFSISPFNEHPGLISFRIDWFYLSAV